MKSRDNDRNKQTQEIDTGLASNRETTSKGRNFSPQSVTKRRACLVTTLSHLKTTMARPTSSPTWGVVTTPGWGSAPGIGPRSSGALTRTARESSTQVKTIDNRAFGDYIECWLEGKKYLTKYLFYDKYKGQHILGTNLHFTVWISPAVEAFFR